MRNKKYNPETMTKKIENPTEQYSGWAQYMHFDKNGAWQCVINAYTRFTIILLPAITIFRTCKMWYTGSGIYCSEVHFLIVFYVFFKPPGFGNNVFRTH